MVSCRNFITITFIMLVLLFMFQTPEVVKDQMNDYSTNTYAKSTGSSFTDKDRKESAVSEWSASRDYIIYIGNVNDKSTGSMVQQWCAYSKRYLDVYSSILKYRYNKERKPDAVVVDCKFFDSEKETKKLENLAGHGVNIIFCNLPNLKKLKGNMLLRELLGIRAILFDRVHVKGIHLQDGLLLGGEKIYRLDDKMEPSMQDLNLAMPWFQVASSAKVYMTGILDDNTEFGNLPAAAFSSQSYKKRRIIWQGVSFQAEKIDFIMERACVDNARSLYRLRLISSNTSRLSEDSLICVCNDCSSIMLSSDSW